MNFKIKIIQNWVQIISPCSQGLARCHVTRQRCRVAPAPKLSLSLGLLSQIVHWVQISEEKKRHNKTRLHRLKSHNRYAYEAHKSTHIISSTMMLLCTALTVIQLTERKLDGDTSAGLVRCAAAESGRLRLQSPPRRGEWVSEWVQFNYAAPETVCFGHFCELASAANFSDWGYCD